MYFSVFGATENNIQTKNIFSLTRKAYLISVKYILKKNRKPFSEFKFLLLKLSEFVGPPPKVIESHQPFSAFVHFPYKPNTQK